MSMQPENVAFPLKHLEETLSTNDDAREWAAEGAEHGAVVWAEMQSKGRGRRGNTWVCPRGEALAFSVVLRPTFPRSLWPRISLLCGLAVAKVLERYQLLSEVKWPNDIMVCGKKISGILIEASADSVIAGIGLNVNVRDFPDDLKNSATSMLLECGRSLDRLDILQQVHESLMQQLRLAADDFPMLLDHLRQRCFLSGKYVKMSISGKELRGTVHGIGDSGELLVKNETGALECIIQADEIRVLA